MNAFWTTLLEINLVLCTVYLGYLVLLKNLTFFRWTRIYLLGGMLLGLVYPFLKSKEVIAAPAEAVILILPDFSPTGKIQGTDYNQWGVYLVCTLFLLLFLRFLIRFFSLAKIHLASRNARFNGFHFRNTFRQINPFSFWTWIYIHQDSHSEAEMQQIIAHERIHTRERHTIDVLLAEICTLICWYNPLVKLLSRAVKNNLEFLVDARVVQSGADKISYQHSLVGISLSGFPQPRHGNQFAFQTLKKRIVMMNKQQSPRSRLLSYALLSPMVLAFAALFTFSCQKESVEVLSAAKSGEEISLERKAAPSLDVTPGKSKIQQAQAKAVGPYESLSLEEPGLAVAQPMTVTGRFHFKDNTHSKMNSSLILLDGEEIDDIKLVTPSDIQAIIVLKDKSAIEKYGEKGKNGVIEIYTKKSPR